MMFSRTVVLKDRALRHDVFSYILRGLIVATFLISQCNNMLEILAIAVTEVNYFICMLMLFSDILLLLFMKLRRNKWLLLNPIHWITSSVSISALHPSVGRWWKLMIKKIRFAWLIWACVFLSVRKCRKREIRWPRQGVWRAASAVWPAVAPTACFGRVVCWNTKAF